MANIRVILPYLSDLRCVKQGLQYTSAQSFGKGTVGYITKLLCLTFVCLALLLAHHNERDLNIFSVFVRGHDLHDKMGDVCRKGLLSDMLDERAKLHW